MVGAFILLPTWSKVGLAVAMESSSSAEFRPVEEGEGYGELFQEETGTAGEIFGSRGGYVHPFLSLGGYVTTNLFRTEDNEESDNVLVASPGIWFALPASRQQLLKVETLNTAPGGLEVSRFRPEAIRRFQGYALYRGEFTQHDRFAEADTDDHRAEGLLQYNFRGGLSLELADIFENNHDPYSTGDAGARELNTFQSNLLNPSISYRISPKTRLQLDYTWYVLDYDQARRDFRDREDNAISGYVFYRFGARTSAFLDYEYITIDYDLQTRPDSDEQRFYGGIQWRATEKSRGRIKLGYGKRDYDGISDTQNFFSAEAQLIHRFTRKTMVYLVASRRAEASDVQGARDVLTERLRAGYVQNLTAKVTGKVTGYFYRENYDGDITIGSQTDEREDKTYGGEIALGWSPTRWFNASAGYQYTERDSNFDIRDYQDHTVFLTLTAAL